MNFKRTNRWRPPWAGTFHGCPGKWPAAILLRLRGAVFICNLLDRRPAASANFTGCRVLNSVAAGHRLARRTALYQAVATLITAVACLSFGRQAALGALVGGAAMTLGSWLAAWGAFSGGVVGAEGALGRLLFGMAAKWIVVIAGLYLAIAVWRLPAMPVLAGAALAAAALLFSAKFALRRN